MDCGYFEKLIYRLPDGDLSEAELRELHEHIEQCDDCRALYEAMTAAHEAMTELAPVPEGFGERVMNAVRAEEKARKAHEEKIRRNAKIKQRWRFGDLGIVAACLALVVVTLNVLYGDLGQRKTADTAEAAPMMLEEAVEETAPEAETDAATGAEYDVAETAMEGAADNGAAANSALTREAADEAAPEAVEPLPEEQTDATEAVTSAPAQSVDAAQLDALLDSYKSIAEDILATADSDFGAQYDCGRLADYDGDSWPEMVLLYSPDGMALNALVVRRDEYSAEPIRFEAQLWPALAGGANGSFSAGTLDTGEHVLFVAATNWEGDVSVATTYVFSLEYGAVTPVYMLDYAFDLDGNLLNCHVMDGEGNTLSRDNEEQFLNVYNARDDVETSFLDDDPDTRLSALFSEDAMAEYRALWG